MNTFGTMALVLILVFASISLGVNSTTMYYIKHFGTRVTEDLKYERETCIRSEPVSVSCKVTFVKDTNTSDKE